MSSDEIYERWVEQRRQAPLPAAFADQVMLGVAEQAAGPEHTNRALREIVFTRLVLAFAASRLGRYALCSGAFLIGVIPYVYLMWLAELVAF